MSAPRSHTNDVPGDYVRTGEAVSLDMTPASLPERLAAAFMDCTTYLGAALIITVIAARTWSSGSDSLVRVFFIGVFSSVTFFAPFVVEVATRGRSLGKWAMNLRVVRDDGGAITARHSAVRVSTGILENWLTAGGIACGAELISSQGKRLGDMAAGTMVCSLGSATFFPPLVTPPGLEGWVRTATILPLDNALAAEARAFLGANRSLNKDLRAQVALSLAERLSRRVQTPLPAGLPPEIVIAAVMVARRNREWERETRRRAHSKARFHEATRVRFDL